jgi:small-conductance mechanosensitive channel
MNEMTDTSIDRLITDTLHRQELVRDLDRIIIADVRRRARRAWFRKWARIIVFSFGLPLVLLVWLACAYLYIKEHDATPFTLSLMVWPTLALIYAVHHVVNNFSAEEV